MEGGCAAAAAGMLTSSRTTHSLLITLMFTLAVPDRWKVKQSTVPNHYTGVREGNVRLGLSVVSEGTRLPGRL